MLLIAIYIPQAFLFFLSHIFWYIVHCPSITSLAGIVRSPQQSEQKMIMIDKYFIFFLSDERYGRVEMVLLLLLSIIAAFNFSLQARGNNYTSICFFKALPDLVEKI